MRLEQIPVVLGFIVVLIGAVLVYDAVKPDGLRPFQDRRRRVRAPVDKNGELLVAGGAFCEGAALIGRDTWRWGTVAVIAGGVLLLAGAILNRAHLKEMLLFRGASRRQEPGEKSVEKKRPPGRDRIR